jgi:hypothetical protein
MKMRDFLGLQLPTQAINALHNHGINSRDKLDEWTPVALAACVHNFGLHAARILHQQTRRYGPEPTLEDIARETDRLMARRDELAAKGARMTPYLRQRLLAWQARYGCKLPETAVWREAMRRIEAAEAKERHRIANPSPPPRAEEAPPLHTFRVFQFHTRSESADPIPLQGWAVASDDPYRDAQLAWEALPLAVRTGYYLQPGQIRAPVQYYCDVLAASLDAAMQAWSLAAFYPAKARALPGGTRAAGSPLEPEDQEQQQVQQHEPEPEREQRLLTYAELAQLLGATVKAARERVARRGWPRTIGKDGRARIQVPVAAIPVDTSKRPSPPAAALSFNPWLACGA